MSEITKCAIYARYSSNNQREASIEDQIRKCREATAAKGWEVSEDHIYYDKAQSGTRVASRDGFREMMKRAISSDCPFQKILVDDTSRIARNTKEALDIFSLLSFYGVHVFYVSQGIDTSDETAEEMITINGLIDSLYIRNLAKETHRGIEGQVIKGYSGGGRRYGYRSEPIYSGMVDIYGNPEAEGYVLRINPDEADTTVRIFKLFGEEGYSAKKIANLLNREIRETGSPHPPRGTYWCSSTILGSKKAFRGILNNEIYIGKYYWNRSKCKRNPENGKKKTIAKDSNRWLVIQKPELRIVTDELWEKAKKRQRQLINISSGKYMKAKSAYSVNLITGLASCGCCGGNIVVVSGGKFAKYGCSNNWNKGESVCGNNAKVRKAELHESVIRALALTLDDERTMEYLAQRTFEIVKERQNQDNQRWRGDALEDQLKKVNKEIENFIKAIKAGIISDTVRSKLLSAEKKRRELERLLQDSQKTPVIEPEIPIAHIRQYAADLSGTLNLHPLLGRTFLSKIVDKMVIQPGADSIKIDIRCNKSGILGDKHIEILNTDDRVRLARQILGSEKDAFDLMTHRGNRAMPREDIKQPMI